MAKKRRTFAWSPLRALMKQKGATIVSKDAVELLMSTLEAYAGKLTETALKFAKHAKRKKICKQDIALAVE